MNITTKSIDHNWPVLFSCGEVMNAEEKLMENGYEGIKYLTDFSYDDALIGVTSDDRAVYDYGLMVS